MLAVHPKKKEQQNGNGQENVWKTEHCEAAFRLLENSGADHLNWRPKIELARSYKRMSGSIRWPSIGRAFATQFVSRPDHLRARKTASNWIYLICYWLKRSNSRNGIKFKKHIKFWSKKSSTHNYDQLRPANAIVSAKSWVADHLSSAVTLGLFAAVCLEAFVRVAFFTRVLLLCELSSMNILAPSDFTIAVRVHCIVNGRQCFDPNAYSNS